MKTNEQARQEAIKAAWGENRWSEFGDHITSDGWLDVDWVINKVEFDSSDCVEEYGDLIGLESLTNYYRPKSLQNIDNNNGWIRVEPDGSNLPTDTKQRYYLGRMYEDGGFVQFLKSHTLEQALYMIKEYGDTHYRPVPPPIPDPIF